VARIPAREMKQWDKKHRKVERINGVVAKMSEETRQNSSRE